MARIITDEEALELAEAGFMVMRDPETGELIELVKLSEGGASEGSDPITQAGNSDFIVGLENKFWNFIFSIMGGLGLARYFPKIASFFEKFGKIGFALFALLLLYLISKIFKL